ncbi:MAG: LamG-like jellyroll fold domain-containing protein [Pirellulales bacterium]
MLTLRHAELFLLAGIFAALPCVPANAEQVTFQQGAAIPELSVGSYAGTEDTMLILWAAGNNFGGREDFDVGNFNNSWSGRSLVRYDLTALADNYSQITDVTLRLTETTASYSPAGSGAVQVFQFADANAGWQEGSFVSGGAGNPAAGDSTWNHRNAPGTSWAGSGGAGTAGVDFVNTVVASTPYTTSTTGTFDLEFQSDVGFMKTWISGGTNAGFYLRNSVENATNRVNFYSSEHGTVSSRPALMIDYLAPVSSGPVQQGTIAHWTFDDVVGAVGVEDIVNGNNATLTNTNPLTVRASGQIGRALDLDGVNDYAITSAPGIGNGSSALTLSIWVNPDAKSNWDGFLTSTGTDFFGLQMDGDDAANQGQDFHFRAKSHALSTNVDVPLNEGSHVVGVWESGAFMSLYLNGELIGHTTSVPSGLVNVNQWVIGSDRLLLNDGGRYFNGLLDDAALWNRALSALEVESLYVAGLAGINASHAELVPEPQSMALLLLGACAGLGICRRARSKARRRER